MPYQRLVVNSIDPYPYENAKLHHTLKFLKHPEINSTTVVMRRGQAFKLAIDFSGRGYDSRRDVLKLMFTFGSHPNVMKGTKVILNLTDHQNNKWTSRLEEVKENSVIVKVWSPYFLPVGKWALSTVTKLQNEPTAGTVYHYPGAIYFLFNPWAPDDPVYFSEDGLLEEYVLNDLGKIWLSSGASEIGRIWSFNQFHPDVLKAIDYIMDMAMLEPENRGDPIVVSRKISKLVNFNDDDGVLRGQWNEPYTGGQHPSSWTGSLPILQQYLNTKKTVKYGQCWVFAGVVNTVCRAMGIPCRVVSNFLSGHDGNADLNIDSVFDENNKLVVGATKDSYWNFHVWNEVWMARPDLPSAFSGWQAIDATPQERSNGVFQCGPASVEAIKCREVGYRYDVPFVLAEVKGNFRRWKKDHSNPTGYSLISTDKNFIGKMVLTKKPLQLDTRGDRDRENITESYKDRKDMRAFGRSAISFAAVMPEDVTFELSDLETVKLGDSFSVTLNFENESEEEKTVKVALTTSSVSYTGNRAHDIKEVSDEFKMAPKSMQTLTLEVMPEEYMDKLVEYCNMRVNAIATVIETNKTWASEGNFKITKPRINIQNIGDSVVGQACTVKFSFTNPLQKALTDCKFRYESPGFVNYTMVPYGDIQGGEEVIVEHQFTPQQSGELTLIGTFDSKELIDVTGAVVFDVAEGDGNVI